MLSQKDIYSHWLKTELNIQDPAEWFPLALSIIGDDGDGYKGVKGIGQKTLAKVFDYVITLCGNSMETVYDHVKNNQPIFSKSYSTSNNALKKIIDNEDIVIRNLKLASFKLLSDYINGDFPTEVFAKRKLIKEITENENKCSRPGILHDALTRAGQSGLLNEQTLTNLF
jgi:5'-3' exonuclease